MLFCRASQIGFHGGFDPGHANIIAVGICKAGACRHIDDMVSVFIVNIYNIAVFIQKRHRVSVVVGCRFIFVKRFQFFFRISFCKKRIHAHGIYRAGKIPQNMGGCFATRVNARGALRYLHTHQLVAVLLDFRYNLKVHIISNRNGRIGSIVI